MDWTTIIQDNFAAIGALIGVMIGFLGSIAKEILTKRMDLQQKQLDSQREYRDKYLTTPILSFIDEMLLIMDRAYWSAKDGQQPDVAGILIDHRDKEGTVKARINAFNDAKLMQAFDELSLRYGRYWEEIRGGAFSKAYEEKQLAQVKAGVVFDRIKPRFTSQ